MSNWALAKQHPSQFDTGKNRPNHKPELVAESLADFQANVLVDGKVEEVLSQTELGQAFLADLREKAITVEEGHFDAAIGRFIPGV